MKRFEKLFRIVITRPVSRRSGNNAGGEGAGRLLNHCTNSNTPLTVSIPIPISQNPPPPKLALSSYRHEQQRIFERSRGCTREGATHRRCLAWLWQSEVARVNQMQIFKGPVKNIFSVWFLPSRRATWGLVWGCHPHRLPLQRRSAQIKSFLPVINAPCSSGGAAFSTLLMLRQFPWQPAGCCFPFYLMETEGPAGCRQSISLTTSYNSSRAHCVCMCACACESVEKGPASFRCPLRAIRVDIDPLLLLHLLHQPRLNAPSPPLSIPPSLPLLLSSSLSLSWYQYVPQSSAGCCAPRSAAC